MARGRSIGFSTTHPHAVAGMLNAVAFANAAMSDVVCFHAFCDGQFGAQPDRPCGPPLSPRLRRGSPCGSLRARGARNVRGCSTTALACREGLVVGLSLSLGQAPLGRVRPKAKRRGEPVAGCGTPANEPALSTPSWGGQRSRPRAGAGGPIHPSSRCGRRIDGGSSVSERRALRTLRRAPTSGACRFDLQRVKFDGEFRP